MGNQANNKKSNSSEPSQKIILRLRSRDIILHYGYKMKLTISDIDVFPHELEGLRLWDIDVIVSRYIILESEKFKNKDVLIFKSGVGIAGIALRKWTDAKDVTMCDFRDEVLTNMVKNCHINEVRSFQHFKINFEELKKSTVQYDHIVCPDLLCLGFQPALIVSIFQKLLRKGGEAVIIMPQKKELAKKLIQAVNKQQFKIVNLILTAEQYESSALFNRLESEKQFPQIGKVNFYAIIFQKLNDQTEKSPKVSIQSHVPSERNGENKEVQVQQAKVELQSPPKQQESEQPQRQQVPLPKQIEQAEKELQEQAKRAEQSNTDQL